MNGAAYKHNASFANTNTVQWQRHKTNILTIIITTGTNIVTIILHYFQFTNMFVVRRRTVYITINSCYLYSWKTWINVTEVLQMKLWRNIIITNEMLHKNVRQQHRLQWNKQNN